MVLDECGVRVYDGGVNLGFNFLSVGATCNKDGRVSKHFHIQLKLWR